MPIQEGGRFTPNDRIVSPGVFTRENDLSGLAQGVADIGAAIVAPFPKGPGFSPTLVTSVTELEDKFGVADGTYYGPYTAKEYIQERGLVTVCRVGALTGYHQEYPFVIWAESGSYTRGDTIGHFTGSSFLVLAPNSSSGWNVTASIDFVTGSNTVNNNTASFVSASLVLALDNIYGTSPSTFGTPYSGSNSYWGQTVTLRFSGETITTQRLYASSSFQGDSSNNEDVKLYHALTSGSFSGSFAPDVTLASSQTDTAFNGVHLISGSFKSVAGVCASPVIYITGLLSGSFGTFNGWVAAGTLAYDVCTNTWTSGSSEAKVLAVLADTQNAPVDSELKAPGFSGSTMASTPNITGSLEAPEDFVLTLKSTDSSVAYGAYQFSLDAASTKYITNVFGDDPTAGNPDTYVAGTKKEAAYTYKIFENAIAAVVADKNKWRILGSTLPDGNIFNGEPMDFTDAFSLNLTEGDSGFSLTNASTPWIFSQKVAPWQSGSSDPTRFRLFKLHTLADGTDTNKMFKVEVSNVKLAGTVAGSDWGSFTLTVRKYSDTDRKPVILEQFPNLNLDPASSNYVARRIGDRYNYIDFNGKILEFGEFSNNSRNIRVEMADNPWPKSAVPYGFEAFATPINSSVGLWTPQMKYTKASVYSLNPGKYPSGITFDDAPTGADAELASLYPTSSAGVGTSEDNSQYFAPLPEFGAYVSIGRNVEFALDNNYTQWGVGVGNELSGSNVVPAEYDAANETTYVKMRKFVLGFQGGFSGQSPAIPINVGGDIIPGNTQGLDCTNSTSAGSIAYKQCIGALGNADEFDINMIAVPGIVHQHHSYVTNLIVDMCETRGDTFYIMDLYVDDGNPSSGQIDEVVGYASAYDTNYAAVYYPWVKILDTNINQIVAVPPSVVLPAVYAANDRSAAEWFAPAGLNRGGIPQATQVTDRTTHSERDTLYEGKVNPIAAFPGTGIAVWGQKTLQDKASSLDRVNVRRLLINLKKFIASISKYLVFEQNVAATRNRFLAIVNPYLESVQQRSGLYAFLVKMDEENNTPDIIDRNILYGQILLKPTRTAEFIVLDFNILPTGASFNNI